MAVTILGVCSNIVALFLFIGQTWANVIVCSVYIYVYVCVLAFHVSMYTYEYLHSLLEGVHVRDLQWWREFCSPVTPLYRLPLPIDFGQHVIRFPYVSIGSFDVCSKHTYMYIANQHVQRIWIRVLTL